MTNRIIAISREFGSGGRTIGRYVARELNIPCYDEELIADAVKKSGLAEEYVKEASEYTESTSWLGNAFTRDFNGHSFSDDLWNIQQETIQELAKQGPCVFVGRCVDYILKDQTDLLTVFIHADIPFRAKRIVQLYGERLESPENRLKDKDKRRKAYYQLYTDMKWGDINNYHIALDSGVIGIDECVDIIVKAYKKLEQDN